MNREKGRNKSCLFLWLGREYLFQTFDDDIEVNVNEIRQLLDDERSEDENEL